MKRLENSKNDYLIDDTLFDAVLESFIITYARPFTVSKPHGALPKRIINKFNKNRKECHEGLMSKRNSFHAHADGKENTILIVPSGVKSHPDIEPSENTAYIFYKEVWNLNRYKFIYSHIRELTLDIFNEIDILEKQIYPEGMPNNVFEIKAL